MIALLLAAALATPEARQQRFVDLLRTYPQRPPAESTSMVAALIDEGPFAERDRAIFWLGSLRLTARDPPGARAWFERLRKEHPASQFVVRADLGEGDAAQQERRFGAALEWYARAAVSPDAAVRELSRISSDQALTMRARQRWAWVAGAFAVLFATWLLGSLLRHRPVQLSPLPAEARVLLPVLAVVALLSLRQDPAPRAAVLQLCAAGALLISLGALRARAAGPRPPERALQAAGTLLALAAAFYAAVYRADLVGMVMETFRAGPD